MLKYVRLLLLVAAVLLAFSAPAQPAPAATPSTCLRVVYQLDYKLDSAVTTPKRVQMILRASSGMSRFQSTGMHLIDSVYTSLKGRREQERMQKSMDAQRSIKNEFRYSIIKEPAKNLLTYHDMIGSEDYQYQEKPPLFAWRITPEKRTIAGYQCQQAYTAFGGRMWEAWFARDIPVSEGPYKFYGLPGLILQVRDTHDDYVFTALTIDLNPRPFDVAADPESPLSARSTAPVIPKAQFLKAKYNDDLTFLDRMAAAGNNFPESIRQNHVQMIKRRNNPLERK